MESYSAEQILSLIRDDLLNELDMTRHASVSIVAKHKHKHSDSMILGVGEGEKVFQVFVKYGAHFSGEGGWDIQSEFEGYRRVYHMDLDPKLFFAVRPLLFRKDPGIIATLFIQGRMLQNFYKRSLMRFANACRMEKSIHFTCLTARWLNQFFNEIRDSRQSVALSTIKDLCKDRIHEIAGWDPGFSKYRISESGLNVLLDRVFQGYSDADIRVVRNHGDFAPHNVLIDAQSRLGVIDIGFAMDSNNPLPHEDAATFLIYLEQMKNNPLYRPSGIRRVTQAFLKELLGEDVDTRGTFIAAYFKKLLAHLAWLSHPGRKPVSRWAEYSFRKWGDNRMKWLAQTARSGKREDQPMYAFLYEHEAAEKMSG